MSTKECFSTPTALGSKVPSVPEHRDFVVVNLAGDALCSRRAPTPRWHSLSSLWDFTEGDRGEEPFEEPPHEVGIFRDEVVACEHDVGDEVGRELVHRGENSRLVLFLEAGRRLRCRSRSASICFALQGGDARFGRAPQRQPAHPVLTPAFRDPHLHRHPIGQPALGSKR